MIATNSLKTRAAGFLAFLTINLMAYGNPSQPTLTIINGSHSKTVTGVADIASFSGVVGNWEVSLAGGSLLAGPFGPILNARWSGPSTTGTRKSHSKNHAKYCHDWGAPGSGSAEPFGTDREFRAAFMNGLQSCPSLRRKSCPLPAPAEASRSRTRWHP